MDIIVLKSYPNQLSKPEIGFLKSPDRAGYKNPSDKYDNIHKKAENSFGTILKILEGLPEIYKDSTKTKPIEKAKSIVDLYGNENINYFIDLVFQKRDEIYQDVIEFPKGPTFVKMDTAALAIRLMRICIKKLKGMVGTGEYQWLLTKIEDLEKEIEGVLESIRQKEIHRDEIKNMKQYLKDSDPKYITKPFSGIFTSCLACNAKAQGDKIETTIVKIEHAPKCKYILSDQPEPQKTMKWIRIIHDDDRKEIRKIKS